VILALLGRLPPELRELVRARRAHGVR
jgi:hypothetical protein